MAGHGGPSFPTLRAGSVDPATQWGKLIAGDQDQVRLKIVDAHARTCEEICAYIWRASRTWP